MSDSLHTARLHGWIDRIRAGDPAARDEFARAAAGRLEQLARRMLRGFPTVARWCDTGDVFQGAALRLLRSLESVRPADTRELMNLAAAQVRRELIDLARRFRGPHGVATNQESVGPDAGPLLEGRAADEGAAELDRWAAFHEAVEQLPAAEREVFGLTFYHGWSQAQIAELFGVDERTVRRRWQAAGLKLSKALGGQIPDA